MQRRYLKMHNEKLDYLLYPFLAVFLTVLFFYMPDTVTESVTASLSVCASRVIPAVFPFSVLSSFFIRSGGADMIDTAFSRPFYKLFGLTHGASALLSGLIFGFPLGAMTAGALYRDGKLERRDASRLLSFAAAASPTFPIFAVGKGLFGSFKIGLFLWLAQAAAAVIIGMISKPRRKKTFTAAVLSPKNVESFPELLSSSVKDASYIILTVCGSVTFFSLIGAVISEIIYSFTENIYLRLFITSLFEFATGCSRAAEAYADGAISHSTALALSGFSIGFSGLSVICQNAAVTGQGINLIPHFIGKLICGAVTAAVGYALSEILFKSVSVSVAVDTEGVSPFLLLPSFLILFVLLFVKIKKKKINSCKTDKKII